MDYKTIEDEVYEFNTDYFEHIAIVAQDNNTFLDDNNLRLPKENYIILTSFLQKTLKNFKILDPSYCSSTLDKLARDIENISTLYKKTENKSSHIEKIFETNFLPTSYTLTNFAKSIINFAELPEKTAQEILYLKQIKKDYIKLKDVFFTVFEETFHDDKKYYLTSLKNSINTKSYYFNALLWKEADRSLTIVKHFSIRKLDGKLNTKDYILFTTALMRPYTDEYRYLQNCLRVFK